MNKFLISICLISTWLLFSQKTTVINGTIKSDSLINSPIGFYKYISNHKLYESIELKSDIKKNKFKISSKFTYPQLYSIGFTNKDGNPTGSKDCFFLDNTLTKIELSKNYEIVSNNGKTHQEFEKKFKPFFKIKDEMDLHNYLNDEKIISDFKLLNYIKENPNSYVAFWILIARINNVGYIDNQFEILNTFSNRFKKNKIWQEFSLEISKINIKKNILFPVVELQNTILEKEKIFIPDNKYVLIDFWFSRCLPCLEAIPKLKELYNKYNSKGFEIISISTDKTENIEKWKERINKYQINWKNYLDENGTFAFDNKIRGFPTVYLLDKKGIVIKKNIALADLDKFLLENLK